MVRQYRIVRDGFSGFEVQVRHWWFPIWLQCGGPFGVNTHSTLEKAKQYVLNHARGAVWQGTAADLQKDCYVQSD